MKKLVQIAGTSGSGKSHLMRSLLDVFRKDGTVEEEFQDDRKSPIGYLATHPKVDGDIFVPGAYDVPTGGCDTIRDVKQVYGIVEGRYSTGSHVIYEGLFCMNQTRGPQLAHRVGRSYVILQLMTPLSTCFVSINQRRAERGEGPLENRNNTEDNFRRANNFCASMRNAGARVIRVERENALLRLMEVLCDD